MSAGTTFRSRKPTTNKRTIVPLRAAATEKARGSSSPRAWRTTPTETLPRNMPAPVMKVSNPWTLARTSAPAWRCTNTCPATMNPGDTQALPRPMDPIIQHVRSAERPRQVSSAIVHAPSPKSIVPRTPKRNNISGRSANDSRLYFRRLAQRQRRPEPEFTDAQAPQQQRRSLCHEWLSDGHAKQTRAINEQGSAS